MGGNLNEELGLGARTRMEAVSKAVTLGLI